MRLQKLVKFYNSVFVRCNYISLSESKEIYERIWHQKVFPLQIELVKGGVVLQWNNLFSKILMKFLGKFDRVFKQLEEIFREESTTGKYETFFLTLQIAEILHEKLYMNNFTSLNKRHQKVLKEFCLNDVVIWLFLQWFYQHCQL